jgi:hypothetical protein
MWVALAVVAIVAVAGVVHARGGLVRTHSEGTPVASSTDDQPTCPLQCLMNYCGFGR